MKWNRTGNIRPPPPPRPQNHPPSRYRLSLLAHPFTTVVATIAAVPVAAVDAILDNRPQTVHRQWQQLNSTSRRGAATRY